MAVPSTMVALDTPMPEFALPDVRTDRVWRSTGSTASVLVVIFLSNHCPYVQRVQAGLARLSKDHEDADVDIVGIAANDPEAYPDDSPERLARVADEQGYRFPVLFDEDQSVAQSFQAACTPDFFVFDANRRLTYRGQLDDARPSNDLPVTGESLRAAVDALLEGRRPSSEQVPAMGCSIKWRPGNEPAVTLPAL